MQVISSRQKPSPEPPRASHRDQLRNQLDLVWGRTEDHLVQEFDQVHRHWMARCAHYQRVRRGRQSNLKVESRKEDKMGANN
jgi:hypothetical protein